MLSRRRFLLLTFVSLVVFAVVLWLMGQPFMCECGTIKLWQSETRSAENSQHLSDWYSFSHIIHGFLFYALFWKLRPKWSIQKRFAAASLLEIFWELLENSPIIINRYRSETISLGYSGDSVINSVSDIVMCMIGFVLARKLPVWVIVMLALGMELLALLFIRDNLLLNVVMLVYPLELIKNWQGARLL